MSEDLESLFENRLRDRFFGKYAAVVTEIDDPQQIGRVRAPGAGRLGGRGRVRLGPAGGALRRRQRTGHAVRAGSGRYRLD
jgi:hypothetical protein